MLGCLDLLAAQHRVCGSITAATTSLQAVLHTSTCTDMESCVDVAQCSGACHTAASASSACLPLALHYTPPPSMLLSQPSLHAATLAATCLPHAATCCHCHTAPHSRSLTPLRAATATPPSSRSSPLKRAVIATRDRSLAAIATWPLPAPHYMLLSSRGSSRAQVVVSGHRRVTSMELHTCTSAALWASVGGRNDCRHGLACSFGAIG